MMEAIKIGLYMIGMGLLSLGSILALSYCWVKYKENRKAVPKNRQSRLLIYWPLIIMNAIPGFVAQVVIDDHQYLELVTLICLVCLGITFVVTFAQCGWKAIWMAPVRWILGVLIGVAGYGAIVIIGVLILFWFWSTHTKIGIKPTGRHGLWVDEHGRYYRKNDDGTFTGMDGQKYNSSDFGPF